MDRLRIVLADDHPIVRDGIKGILRNDKRFEVSAEFGNGKTACDYLEKEGADIAIIDISMPGLTGIEVTRYLNSVKPELKIKEFSAMSDEHTVMDVLKSGAKGFIAKDDVRDELIKAVEVVSGGEDYISESVSRSLLFKLINKEKEGRVTDKALEVLSDREIEVLTLLAEGLSYKEAGEKLCISARTVETHKTNIMSKLELRTMVDLIKYALRNGIIKL